MVNIPNNLGISNFPFSINHHKQFENNIGITITVNKSL